MRKRKNMAKNFPNKKTPPSSTLARSSTKSDVCDTSVSPLMARSRTPEVWKGKEANYPMDIDEDDEDGMEAEAEVTVDDMKTSRTFLPVNLRRNCLAKGCTRQLFSVNHTGCRLHRRRNRSRKELMRVAFCLRCKERPAAEGATLCDTCQQEEPRRQEIKKELKNKKLREARQERRQSGLCIQCREPAMGFARCVDCRAKVMARIRRNTKRL
jgi:hypothetical protein